MNYDMELYSKQVEKLIVTEPKNRLMENVLGLGEEVLLFPGHGPATTVGEERAHNPFFP